MNKALLICMFFAGYPCFGQFQFSGDLGPDNSGKLVYLSLVEDYRKVSRPYSDQIIGKQTADRDGKFVFTGDQLNAENRIYRIHIDDCQESGLEKGHVLKNCPGYKSLLFLAHNRDTVMLPASFDFEVFCEIQSTNSSSQDLLEVELLKENMAFDLIEAPSSAGTALIMARWFKRWQEFGEDSQEPLTELYIYAFLSDRANETRAYYLNDLAANPYYEQLAGRLQSRYPEAPFTRLYHLELQADRNLEGVMSNESQGLLGMLAALLLVSMSANAYLLHKRRKPSTAPNEPMGQLTAQERRIARSILGEASNKEIADTLFISVSTVKTHINSLYKKLGVRTRDELKKRLQE